MHSTHDNIKFTSYYDENAAYERYELIITVYELLELLSLKYQGNFRNINERKWICFWFSSTHVSQMS